MDFPNLNRRHKAGLLLVVAGAGFCLLLDLSFRQTMGAILLGLVCTWLVANASVRLASVIGCFGVFAVGILILTVPVHRDWRDTTDARQYKHLRQDSTTGQYYGQTDDGSWEVVTQKVALAAIALHDQPSTQFSAWRSVKSNKVTSLAGIVLALCGLLSGLFLAFPASRAQKL